MSAKYFANRRTVFRWVLFLVVVGLAAFGGRLIHLRIVARARVGGPIPYTVTLRELIHGRDGHVTVGPESTWAVRSDGSTVIRLVEKRTERILYFASGLQVTINETSNTKTSMMPPNMNPTSSLRDPNSKCTNSFAGKPITSMPETFLGEETVAGYRTAKIASNTITAWYALEYGCALVKDRWDFSTGEMSEKELVALVPGEPNAALFEVPASAREVPPSERILGPTKECTGCDAHVKEVFQKRDEEYKRFGVKSQ